MLRGFHIESVVNWLIIRWSHEDNEIGGKNRIRTCGTFYSPFGFQPNALNRALPPFQRDSAHGAFDRPGLYFSVFSALGPTVSIPPMSYAFFYQEERRGIPKSLPSESVDSVGVSVECNRRLNGLAEGAVACSRVVSASLHG